MRPRAGSEMQAQFNPNEEQFAEQIEHFRGGYWEVFPHRARETIAMQSSLPADVLLGDRRPDDAGDGPVEARGVLGEAVESVLCGDGDVGVRSRDFAVGGRERRPLAIGLRADPGHGDWQFDRALGIGAGGARPCGGGDAGGQVEGALPRLAARLSAVGRMALTNYPGAERRRHPDLQRLRPRLLRHGGTAGALGDRAGDLGRAALVQPALAGPVPVRPGGVGLAIVDLHEAPADEGRGRVIVRTEGATACSPPRVRHGMDSPAIDHSGNGSSLVSGANGNATSPTRNTAHMVTPAYRIGREESISV